MELSPRSNTPQKSEKKRSSGEKGRREEVVDTRHRTRGDKNGEISRSMHQRGQPADDGTESDLSYSHGRQTHQSEITQMTRMKGNQNNQKRKKSTRRHSRGDAQSEMTDGTIELTEKHGKHVPRAASIMPSVLEADEVLSDDGSHVVRRPTTMTKRTNKQMSITA